jgi:uncharacterized membrane protein YhaH (DUF805 family)
MNWTWFLFSFKGRINRKSYWIFHLFIFLGGMILGLFARSPEDVDRLQLMFMIWIFWPSLAVQAKRWHDRNKSAWWILINFIPIAGPIWALIENGFLPGTPGPNRFGPAPSDNSKSYN